MGRQGYLEDNFEAACRTAASRGQIAVKPAIDELFIDIDSEEGWLTFLKNFKKVNDQVGVSDWYWRESLSERPMHRHVIVKLSRPIEDDIERIVLQMLLGSDRVREALSWQRALRGDEWPTLFFEWPEGKSGPRDSSRRKPIMDTSRLMAHCQFCDLTCSRNETYVVLPEAVPSFNDVCPRCGTDDVEVYDEELVELAAPRERDEGESWVG